MASKYPTLDRKPGESNWVDKAGGLPSYIDKIARLRTLHYEKGMTISRAIATAVETVRKWARGGGNVKAATRAKAAKAVAEWEAKKAASKAKTSAKKAADMSTEDFAARLVDLGMEERKACAVGREIAAQLAAKQRTKGVA